MEYIKSHTHTHRSFIFQLWNYVGHIYVITTIKFVSHVTLSQFSFKIYFYLNYNIY